MVSCSFFRSVSCSGSCANEVLRKMHEDGMIVFDAIDCADCEYNTGQCSDCIFEDTEFCEANLEGRVLS